MALDTTPAGTATILQKVTSRRSRSLTEWEGIIMVVGQPGQNASAITNQDRAIPTIRTIAIKTDIFKKQSPYSNILQNIYPHQIIRHTSNGPIMTLSSQ